MNKNDMRGVVYLIISLVALYYLLDNFLGKGKLNNFVDNFIGNFGGLPAINQDTQGNNPAATQPAAATAAAPAKAATDPGSVKIPAPQPDPGAVKIPQPQGNQTWPAKPKSGSNGLSLNDVFGHFNPFPLGVPLAAAGAATVAGVGALLTLPQTLGRELGGAF